MSITRVAKLLLCLIFVATNSYANSATPPSFIGPPSLSEQVSSGKLPPITQRLPKQPRIDHMPHPEMSPGKHGGVLKMLMAKSKDIRQMSVYGYARLVKFNYQYQLIPDILLDYEVKEGRIFTLTLRDGHRWSDGHPFTTEDFRYYWEDVANHKKLYPSGPPASLRVADEFPKVEILSPTQIRYSWSEPNPDFLLNLAKAVPLKLFLPAHYLKNYHPKFQQAETLDEMVKNARARSWASMHTKHSRMNRYTNPKLPVLHPWVTHTAPPADRFVFTRNPYFHKVDTNGRQLPYIDEVVINISEKKLISGKTATGGVNLQGRYLRFDDTALLKRNENAYAYKTRLWRIAKGAHMALFPNLNHTNARWRELFRNVKFRRALSLAINRYEINRVIYFGLTLQGQNTLLPESPLYLSEYRDAWSRFDLEKANRLLDELGFTEKDDRGIRLFPDGESLDIIVETGGTNTEQSDILLLVADTWKKAGIKLHIKPSSLENVRSRIFAGQTQMTISSGWENGIASADIPPRELAPVRQEQYQWSKWGQYYETGGMSGTTPDTPEAKRLIALLQQWYQSQSPNQRESIWRKMLAIHRDNIFSIGIIAGVLQPIVVHNNLRNVPTKGIWNFEPGAHFGIYGMDRFWLSRNKNEN